MSKSLQKMFCCISTKLQEILDAVSRQLRPTTRAPLATAGAVATQRVYSPTYDGSTVTVTADRVDLQTPNLPLWVNQFPVGMPGWNWGRSPNPDGTHNYDMVFTPSASVPLGIELSIPNSASSAGMRTARVEFSVPPITTQANATLNPDGTWTLPELTAVRPEEPPFTFPPGPVTMRVFNVGPGASNLVGIRLWNFETS